MKLRPVDRRKTQGTKKGQGRASPSNDDAMLEQILDDLRNMPQEALVKKIAALPGIRRGKVLNLCRRLAKGGYPVEDQLDQTIDRILEANTG